MNIEIPIVTVQYVDQDSKINLPVNSIFALGKNYAEHVEELNWYNKDAVIFQKNRTCLIRRGEPMHMPVFSKQVHYEVELVLYIGKQGKNIPESEARAHIAAVSVGLDFTARDLQDLAKKNGSPWTIAKAFDDSGYVSHFLPSSLLERADELELVLRRNGELRQKESLTQMIHKPDNIVSMISKYFTLYPGDLIFTGTPAGVGSIYAGNEIEIILQDKENVIIRDTVKIV